MEKCQSSDTNRSTGMFTIQTLTEPVQQARFATAYEAASRGVNINPDYLHRVRQVRVACLGRHPDMFLGGYVINNVPPHRYFVAPGQVARQKALALMDLGEDDLVEIGAIWF